MLLLCVMTIAIYMHTNTLMFSGLRLCVPLMWVLTISLTFAAASQILQSSLDSLSLQLWLTEHSSTHLIVNQNINDIVDTFAYLVDQSTDVICPVVVNQ